MNPLRLALVTMTIFVSLKSFAATPLPTESMKPTSFELCFVQIHGRCFQTVQKNENTILLKQYGGLSDSEAPVTRSTLEALDKDIVRFFSVAAYSATKKNKLCEKPLIFKRSTSSGHQDQTLCLERLKKKDSEKLLNLVNRISLASKKP